MMDEDVNALRKEMDNLIDKVYPVGSIYMSVSEVEPSILFGGEWEQIEDKFLLAAGTNHQNGSTGGSATHTLSVNEMPSHTHTMKVEQDGGSGTNRYCPSGIGSISGSANNSAGGGSAHNNMPPYLAVFMWKRSA